MPDDRLGCANRLMASTIEPSACHSVSCRPIYLYPSPQTLFIFRCPTRLDVSAAALRFAKKTWWARGVVSFSSAFIRWGPGALAFALPPPPDALPVPSSGGECARRSLVLRRHEGRLQSPWFRPGWEVPGERPASARADRNLPVDPAPSGFSSCTRDTFISADLRRPDRLPASGEQSPSLGDRRGRGATSSVRARAVPGGTPVEGRTQERDHEHPPIRPVLSHPYRGRTRSRSSKTSACGRHADTYEPAGTAQ